MLLSVAREVFLERGIRATTLEVAERAGVSEGVLFHRFKSKEGLFSAAMNFDAAETLCVFENALQEIEGLEVREGLEKFSNTLLELGRVAVPLMMMSWSNPQLSHEIPFDKKRAKFREFLKAFGAYLERRMAEGKLRRMDAEVLARALIGSVHHYCMTAILMNADETVIPQGMFVRDLVELLLHGAAPTSEPLASGRLPAARPRSRVG